MADDKKITELAAATLPLSGGEILEIVQGGVNKQVVVTSVNSASSVTSVSGTSNRITSTGGNTPVIDLSSVYTLDQATPSTTGGTITLDCNNQIQRMFVGSASFAGAKAIALSNTTNTLVINFVLTLTNLAAVLTFPTTFTTVTSDSRWNDGAHTFTPSVVGKHEFSAVFDGTDWLLLIKGPYS